MKPSIQLIILIIGISFVMGFILTTIITELEDLQQKPLLYTSHYTKAICNDNNWCVDVEITCNSTSVIDIKPIRAVQFSQYWIDKRPKEVIEKWC